jgi:hypothetical protein
MAARITVAEEFEAMSATYTRDIAVSLPSLSCKRAYAQD